MSKSHDRAVGEPFVFMEEGTPRPKGRQVPDWVILIVDDEEDVHRVTKLVLAGFTFQKRGITFLSAYSGDQAKRLMAGHPEIAIILLDVVMDSGDTGLALVRYIREEMGNKFMRIILRTGQPGQAPEGRIIIDYDINDYKTKTELTEQKLITTIVASLRAYTDLIALDYNRKGLEKIIEGAANVFELQSLKKLTTGVLTQLVSLLSMESDAMFCRLSGLAATVDGGEIKIISATGKYAGEAENNVEKALPPEISELIIRSTREKRSLHIEGAYIGYFCSSRGSQNIIYVEGWDELGETEKRLIEVFCSNVSVAFDNLYLNIELEDSQKEIIFALGELVDMRSSETGNHVRRVGEYSRLLAVKTGLSEEEAEVIRVASAMHDIGKLGIPDIILNKQARLSLDEFEAMKMHSSIGAELLKHSNRDIMRTAAVIAIQHHERYDGSGYPLGLSGTQIHPAARITSIADVFDALSHDRIYRPAMTKDELIRYFRDENASKFDPVLLASFLENIDQFYAIQEIY
jgi:response regulator RpfG family c-di-GMP phosphodiesterase